MPSQYMSGGPQPRAVQAQAGPSANPLYGGLGLGLGGIGLGGYGLGGYGLGYDGLLGGYGLGCGIEEIIEPVGIGYGYGGYPYGGLGLGLGGYGIY